MYNKLFKEVAGVVMVVSIMGLIRRYSAPL
jgi:hypothetical protein